MSMFAKANKTPTSFSSAMSHWRESADSWFDGSVASVDARLRRCASLTHTAQCEVANSKSASHLGILNELSADRIALGSLRHDLLTGSADREAVGVSRSPGRVAAADRIAAAYDRSLLTKEAKRWVDLESVKFITANADMAHNTEELSGRARAFVATQTASPVLARVFVSAVLDLGASQPRTKTASTPPAPRLDFDPSLIFIA